MHTSFLTPKSSIPPYLALPRFLLDSRISATEKILYALLLNRAQLSQGNQGWKDEEDHVFIIFPVSELASRMHKCEMTIKNSLGTLEKEDLILRKGRGIGRANIIYVKIPEDRFPFQEQTENCSSDGRKTVRCEERKLSGNKNYRTNSIYTNTRKNRCYDCDEDESL